jgi:hypothetical protein
LWTSFRVLFFYLLVGALFERNQFLNQKPINVIDCIKAVDGEVRVPRVGFWFKNWFLSNSAPTRR